MKLTIMNYDIDTDIEKNYQELSDKFHFWRLLYIPR